MIEDSATTPWPLGSRYTVLPVVLGRGAFGTVYEGEERATGDRVAVKVFERWLRDDPAAVERILSERSLLSDVTSEHVVRVRDLVAEGEVLALVSDFVDGMNLREFAHLRSSSGVMSAAEAAALLVGILDGMASLHATGIVHRDLKPENVLITSVDTQPRPLLVDFGLATLAADARTQVVGTPYYMPPEVLTSGPVLPESDVYAAGVILYELLSGHTPFEGAGTLAALARLQGETAAPRPEGLDDELWLVVKGMLARDPLDRPDARTARDRLVQLLPSLSRDLPIEVRSVGARPRLTSVVEPFLDLPLDAGQSTLDRGVRRAEASLQRRSAKATAISTGAAAVASAISAAVAAVQVIPSASVVLAVVGATVVAVAAPGVAAVVIMRRRRRDSLAWRAMQVGGRMQSAYLKALNSVDVAGPTPVGRQTVIRR